MRAIASVQAFAWLTHAFVEMSRTLPGTKKFGVPFGPTIGSQLATNRTSSYRPSGSPWAALVSCLMGQGYSTWLSTIDERRHILVPAENLDRLDCRCRSLTIVRRGCTFQLG